MTPLGRPYSVLIRLINPKVCATMAAGVFSSEINFSRANCVHNTVTDLFSGSVKEKYNNNDNNKIK
jgi:hypothetical protein